jgi:hypothetical protein
VPLHWKNLVVGEFVDSKRILLKYGQEKKARPLSESLSFPTYLKCSPGPIKRKVFSSDSHLEVKSGSGKLKAI